MLLAGFDIGTSAVKACVLDAESGKVVASGSSPADEMAVHAPRQGWAEQDPEEWWEHACRAMALARASAHFAPEAVKAVGIAYQMHGLVLADGAGRPLRPAIIWCDGRAVETGDTAASALGRDYWSRSLLNHPGNFTASRLLWVRDNEPDLFSGARFAMLPGDWIAMRMTGEPGTSDSGLSEMILWDFGRNRRASEAEEKLGIPAGLVPEAQPAFSVRGGLTNEAASALGLRPGTPVSYRAGDQPNNAFSLGALSPGQVAATAGTSGVVFGISDRLVRDEHSRVNVFLHVNHEKTAKRIGALMCVNGAGSLYRWVRSNLFGGRVSYREMDQLAASAPPGSKGLVFLPYGNGPERTLMNRESCASILGLDFNRHTQADVLRAGLEGVIFALLLGMDAFRNMGIRVDSVSAGHANLFRCGLFARMFATATRAPLHLFDTDGAQGAARGAGVGAGLFGIGEAFRGLNEVGTIGPAPDLSPALDAARARWLRMLETGSTLPR